MRNIQKPTLLQPFPPSSDPHDASNERGAVLAEGPQLDAVAPRRAVDTSGLVVLVDGLPPVLESEIVFRLSRHPGVSLIVVPTDSATECVSIEQARGRVAAADLDSTSIEPSTIDVVIQEGPDLSAFAWACLGAGARLIRSCQTDDPINVDEEVLGIPELSRAAVRAAGRVRNPGPLATAIGLAMTPLHRTASHPLMKIDARTPREAEIGYGPADAATVRSVLEADPQLPDADVFITDARHHDDDLFKATLLLENIPEIDPLESLFRDRFHQEPFVHVVDDEPTSALPGRTNHACIALDPIRTENRLAVTCAFDPLVRGGAGQAIQNLNVMFHFPETMALDAWREE